MGFGMGPLYRWACWGMGGSCGGSAHAELFIYRIALVNYSFGLDIFSTTKIDLERGIMWLFSQKRFEHRLSKTRRRGRNFDCSHMQRRKVPVKKVEKMVLVFVIFGKLQSKLYVYLTIEKCKPHTFNILVLLKLMAFDFLIVKLKVCLGVRYFFSNPRLNRLFLP